MDATTTFVDTDFGTPRTFVPIDDAARDGERQLVRRGDTLAVAQWTGSLWSYPYGEGPFQGDAPEQIDFEPTHYAPDKTS